jgi:hypothetical protein
LLFFVFPATSQFHLEPSQKNSLGLTNPPQARTRSQQALAALAKEHIRTSTTYKKYIPKTRYTIRGVLDKMPYTPYHNTTYHFPLYTRLHYTLYTLLHTTHCTHYTHYIHTQSCACTALMHRGPEDPVCAGEATNRQMFKNSR